MNIDITATKVLTPALLFAVLSPGLLLSLPSKRISDGMTSVQSVIIHALVLGVVYYLLAKYALKVTLTQADMIVPVLLFILLSPGMLLTLPPGSAGVFQSFQTSTASVGVHTLVYAIVFAFMRSSFPKYY
jgi:hypothetical protein